RPHARRPSLALPLRRRAAPARSPTRARRSGAGQGGHQLRSVSPPLLPLGSGEPPLRALRCLVPPRRRVRGLRRAGRDDRRARQARARAMNDLLRYLLFLPEQASTVAKDVDHLHFIVIGTTMIASGATGALALFFFVRFKR